MADSAAPERQCAHCGKKQSELSEPLKACAKCHTQAYCSRDCQKEGWKNHRKVCAGNNAAEPPVAAQEDLLKNARQTVDFLKALSHDPNFRKNLRSIPQSASGLMYLSDFVSRTFREYWTPLLAPQKYAELSADLESFHGMEREQHLKDMAAKFEEVKGRDESFDKDKWPTLDKQKFGDCISRNIMAANIVRTPSQQAMMGGPYNYSDEVKEVCRQIVGE